MANIFNIDWNNVGKNLIPHFWRDGSFEAYIRSILAPIQTNSDNLLSLQQETVNFLKYTGQHKVLEEYLNDTYDPLSRRIYITENDIAGIDPIAIYISGETTDTPLTFYLSGESNPAPLSFYLSGEASTGDNFTVNIPTVIVFTETIITSQLRNYVEASKNFNFVTF
jgi:hypothetical protein